MSPDAQRARDRRAFIRDHHPDRGGDPKRFVDGLRAFEATETSGAVVTGRPHPTIRARVRSALHLLLRKTPPPRVR